MSRSAPIRPTASSSCPNAGSSSEPSPGLADAEGSPRIGSASIARRSPSSSSRLSASCCENYAIQDDVSGQTLSASTAAKAGVAALSAALGEELAGEGILVNAVAPSIMDTPTNRRDMPNANFDAWPKVEEVAATILFLASPENKVSRGGVIPVFGASSQSAAT